MNEKFSSPPTAPSLDERLPATVVDDVVVLPVIEEHVVIQREIVETGRVRLTRRVHELNEEITVPVQHEEVAVERVPLNQTLPAGAVAPGIRYEGETMIIPVIREVAVVETRLLLVEELRVTKRRVTTQHTESLPLRHEEIIVERLPPLPPTNPTSLT